VRAQVRAGISSSQRILGLRPTGVWLPEGAYRPNGPWSPPIPWGDKNNRLGIDQIVADENLSHFFVEDHLLGKFDSQNSKAAREPFWVSNNGYTSRVLAAFARDPEICKQVWCGFVGYPADGLYLEFHKRHGPRRGLRYWKVTDRRSDLGGKQLYYPDDVAGKIYEHAKHFCNQVKKRLTEYHQRTGRGGVVVACFDAELFGHWWFEGPRFLQDVLLTLNADPEVELCTPEAYLEKYQPQNSVSLLEGSWGEGGDHRVWANEKVDWMWRIEYQCETLFGKLTYHLPWRKHQALRKILEKAGRELLLLQASDWPFAVARCQAGDYGIKRFMGHVARFENLTEIAENLAVDPNYLDSLNETQKFDFQDPDVHDVIFPQIDLNWWNM
jgi:1,4-alpha-glucan branching enzyme